MDVTSTASNYASALEQYATKPEEKTKSNELGKDEFLKLLVTQMENQNPLEPQDNGEFIAQLAQFSSLEGIDNLNDTMGNFVNSYQSSSALGATALVGKQVLIESDSAFLEQGGLIKGVVELPVSSPDVNLKIYDANGQLVRSIALGSQTADDHQLVWDGANNDGDALPTGVYTIEATARINGEQQQLNTLLGANVNSVTLGTNGGGTTLNLAGIGKVALDDVKTIQ